MTLSVFWLSDLPSQAPLLGSPHFPILLFTLACPMLSFLTFSPGLNPLYMPTASKLIHNSLLRCLTGTSSLACTTLNCATFPNLLLSQSSCLGSWPLPPASCTGRNFGVSLDFPVSPSLPPHSLTRESCFLYLPPKKHIQKPCHLPAPQTMVPAPLSPSELF